MHRFPLNRSRSGRTRKVGIETVYDLIHAKFALRAKVEVCIPVTPLKQKTIKFPRGLHVGLRTELDDKEAIWCESIDC